MIIANNEACSLYLTESSNLNVLSNYDLTNYKYLVQLSYLSMMCVHSYLLSNLKNKMVQ